MSTSQAPSQPTDQIIRQTPPLKNQLPFTALKPPFGDYHRFSAASAFDHRQKEPEAIVVKSPVSAFVVRVFMRGTVLEL
ncbi:hypothetical protein RHMOL_Rhmol01G0276500 [Rhododendron molle]|uniref:Uncharacterized protein n=1 Tax=Rhododendron molle TaxID=49168 RepID=A0ACC0Q600_RHOML|nr:hypothetical protein RHMOL_Rhmol01G0276500 [Rhododendron molle]